MKVEIDFELAELQMLMDMILEYADEGVYPLTWKSNYAKEVMNKLYPLFKGYERQMMESKRNATK